MEAEEPHPYEGPAFRDSPGWGAGRGAITPAPPSLEQEESPSALRPRFPAASSHLTSRGRHLHNPRSCFLKSSKSEWIWPSRKFRINFVEIAEARRQGSCAVEADTRHSQTGDSHPDIRRQPKTSCQAASGPFPLLPGWKDGCCPRGTRLRDYLSHPAWRDSRAREAALGHPWTGSGSSPWRVLGALP